jgi:hypothetical protein
VQDIAQFVGAVRLFGVAARRKDHDAVRDPDPEAAAGRGRCRNALLALEQFLQFAVTAYVVASIAMLDVPW